MKELFPGYFSPSEAELTSLWGKATFVFDSNFLLNIYRYSKETREELFKVFKNFGNRVWVSNQAALEFLENRLEVVDEQISSYDSTQKHLKELLDTLKSENRHPFIEESLLKTLMEDVEKVSGDLQKRKAEYTDLLEKDELLNNLSTLLKGKVGMPYSKEKMADIFKDGENRYKNGIPPGYKDSQKEGNRRFGDLLIWNQIIDKAKKDKTDIIFVTGDVKEDWWHIFKGKIKGPRPELVEEVKSQAKVSFHMYQANRFLEFVNKYSKQQITQKTIQEVNRLSREDVVARIAALRNPLLYNKEATGVWGSLSVAERKRLLDFLGTSELANLSEEEKAKAKVIEHLYALRINRNLEALRGLYGNPEPDSSQPDSKGSGEPNENQSQKPSETE